MKIYEGMFLVNTKEARKASASVEEHVRSLVAKCGGKIEAFDKWDERKLAYEIKGTRNGTYYLTYFTGEEDTVNRLYRECELSPVVLRALFLRVKKIPEPKGEASGETPAAEGAPGGDEAAPAKAEETLAGAESIPSSEGEGAPASVPARADPEGDAGEVPDPDTLPRESGEG